MFRPVLDSRPGPPSPAGSVRPGGSCDQGVHVSIDPKPIRVLFVEDHQLLADALAALLAREHDIEVVGVAGSVAEAKVLARERVDVVLMDYRLPDGTGADATRAIKARWPAARVVMLTAVKDDETVLESIQAGADGYLTKDRAAEDVVLAVRAAYAGETLLPRSVIIEISRRVAAAKERGDERRLVEPLTPRELEVLRALTDGLSTPEICERLYITPNTLRTHVQNLMGKLRVHSKLEAVAFALKNRLVEPPRPEDAAHGQLSAAPRLSPSSGGRRPSRPARSVGTVAAALPSPLIVAPLLGLRRPRIALAGSGDGSSFRRSSSRRSPWRNAPQRGQRRSSAKSDSSGATV